MSLRTTKVSIRCILARYQALFLLRTTVKICQYMLSGLWVYVGFLGAHALHKLWNADLVKRLSFHVWHLIFDLNRHESARACRVFICTLNGRIVAWAHAVAIIVRVEQLRRFAAVERLIRRNEIWLIRCWHDLETTTVESFCLEYRL